MRDPRLVEIDFLMDLEREEKLIVHCSGWTEAEAYVAAAEASDQADTDPDPSVVANDPPRLYGTDPRRFREMIHSLLREGLIAGLDMEGTHPVQPRTYLQEGQVGLKVQVRMMHPGRVHLWNLRDELLRDPDLDPFGLRSRAAWNRDLFVKLRWASSEAPLSVMFLDLDHFKKVNDDHGHTIGDEVLQTTFRLVRSAVGIRGEVYRYGGEEVGVLLPAIALDEAKAIAEEIRALIEREVCIQVKALKAPQTLSIGVTSFMGVIENEIAVTKVDKLMYAAKRSGRNRVEAAT